MTTSNPRLAALVVDVTATDFGVDVAAADVGLECFLDAVAVTIEGQG